MWAVNCYASGIMIKRQGQRTPQNNGFHHFVACWIPTASHYKPNSITIQCGSATAFYSKTRRKCPQIRPSDHWINNNPVLASVKYQFDLFINLGLSRLVKWLSGGSNPTNQIISTISKLGHDREIAYHTSKNTVCNDRLKLIRKTGSS